MYPLTLVPLAMIFLILSNSFSFLQFLCVGRHPLFPESQLQGTVRLFPARVLGLSHVWNSSIVYIHNYKVSGVKTWNSLQYLEEYYVFHPKKRVYYVCI